MTQGRKDGTEPSRDALLNYARLERRRAFDGLSLGELRRWVSLKRQLNQILNPGWDARRGDPRRSVRIPTHLRCSFKSLGALDSALITNLSCGGVFVGTEKPLPVGTRVKLHICLDEEGIQLELTGIVVSSNIGPAFELPQVGMGIKLVDLAPELLKQVHDLYERVIRKYGTHAHDSDA